MAKEYFEKLSILINELNINNEVVQKIEVKHFFSGAALYANKSICVSWSPVGLAFKLPENKISTLLKNGKAIPLRYFPNGNIKKDYALFENPDDKKQIFWKKYFLETLGQM